MKKEMWEVKEIATKIRNTICFIGYEKVTGNEYGLDICLGDYDDDKFEEVWKAIKGLGFGELLDNDFIEICNNSTKVSTL